MSYQMQAVDKVIQSMAITFLVTLHALPILFGMFLPR